MRLTPKQARYVQNKLAGMGNLEAALDAGYAERSASVTAANLNKHPLVKRELEKANERAFLQAEVTANDIVREAWNIATDGAAPAAARVSALALLAKRHREFSDRREVDVRVVSLIANAFGLEEEELIEEAQAVTRLLRAGPDGTLQ
jgi:hypothetical protein